MLTVRRKTLLVIVLLFVLMLACAGCLPDKEAASGKDAVLQGPESSKELRAAAPLFQEPPVIVDRADTILVMNEESEAEALYPGLGGVKVKRHYPYGSLAAALLGFRGQHGHGLYGIEYLCDTLSNAGISKQEMPTDRLALTISKDIQLWAEKDLERQMKRLGASRGSLVMMDVKNGEILAMASLPVWNPENAWDSPGRKLVNYAVQDEIDAWMFFPILEWGRRYAQYREAVAAANKAAEEGAPKDGPADESAIFEVQEEYKELFERKARKRWSWSTPAPGLALWSPWNGEKMSEFEFSPLDVRQMWSMGIGQETGLSLTEEKSGSLPTVSPSGWDEIRFNPVRATPLQLARAFSALINAGTVPVPAIVKNMKKAGPEYARIDWLESDASDWLRDELALSDGPSIAAVKRKDIPDAEGEASFIRRKKLKDGSCIEVVSMGFWPEKEPRIAYITVLGDTKHDPRIRRGTLGKTIFMAKRAYGLIEQESRPDTRLACKGRKCIKQGLMPDFQGMTMRQAVVTALEFGLQPRVGGSGKVVRQRPAPGARLGKDKMCVLECSDSFSTARR